MSGRFGSRALVNAALLSTVASLVSYAGGMVVSILVARALGPIEYGQYAYVVWLVGLMVTLAASGFSNSAMRFIPEYVAREQPGTSLAIHRRLRRQVLASIAAATVLLSLAWPWIRPQGTESVSPLFLSIAVMAFATKSLFMFESASAKGYGFFWVEAACLASLALVNVAGVSALWKLHSQLGAFLAWFAALSLAHLVLVLMLVRSRRAEAERPASIDDELRGRIRTHLRWGMLLAAVSVLGGRSFETLLLNTHVGAKEVGYFTIAAMLTRSAVDLLAGGLSSVMVPIMSHAFGAGGDDGLRKVFVNASRYYQFIGLTLAGTAFFWAEPAIRLMYGERYLPVVLVLQVLMVGSCLMMPSGGLTALLSATENQKLRASFTVLSVCTSALLALLLVPRWGLNGALASVTASPWIVFVVTVTLVDRWVGFRLPYAELARQFALAVLAAAAAWLVLRWNPGLWGHVLAGSTYLLLFVGASLVAGVWSPAEKNLARSYLTRVPLLRRLT